MAEESVLDQVLEEIKGLTDDYVKRNAKRGNSPETGHGHLTVKRVASPKRTRRDSPISLRENKEEEVS